MQVPDFSKPPRKSIPAFKLGPNLVEWQTPTGRRRDVIYMDAEDQAAVLATFERQQNPLPIYKDHKKDEGAFGALKLVKTDFGIGQDWTLSQDGQALVASGRFLFDSPEILTVTKQGRKHLREIRSGSLVNEPARTGSEPLLLSANMATRKKLMQEIVTLSGDLEAALAKLGADDPNRLFGGAVLELVKALKNSLGSAIAEMQSMIADHKTATATMAADTKAADTKETKDAAQLGVEVLRLTGATSSDEALGKLELKDVAIQKMAGLLVDLGIETGRLEASDKDKFATYSPARLCSRLAVEPMNLSSSAKPEKPKLPETQKEPELDLSDYDAAISAAKIRRAK